MDEQALVARMYDRLDAEADEIRAELEGRPDPERAAALRRRLAALRGAEHGLVFGRIDRVDGTSLHIGRRGLRVDGEPLLVDWRAPAAAPFYAATPAHPMGVRRRRHLRLAGRKVVSVADEILDGSAPAPDDVVGDGPLAEALAAPRTGRMGDAIATLQAEQDAIVRSPYQGITVVQGGPGTGKTVVALHRAAYVLFAFPAAAARGVLVVGPDARFLDYISRVLPSLGENDVRLATRNGVTATEPQAGLPEHGHQPGADAAARSKGRAEMADRLAELVAGRRPHAATIRLSLGTDTVEIGAAAMSEAIAAADGMPHNPGRAAFKEYLVAELARIRAEATAATLERIDAETVELTGVDLDAAVAADLRSLGLADDRPRPATSRRADERATTHPGDTGDRPDQQGRRGRSAPSQPANDPAPSPPGSEPAPSPAVPALAELDDVRAARASIAADPLVDEAIERIWPRLDPADVVRALLGQDADVPWTTADLALLDEASALIDGPPEEIYGHVVVDEAQELTEMDWRVVLRRCPSRSVTVVGDFAQAGTGSTVTGWRQAVGERFELHTLTVNYRTTAEILEYNRGLLAEIAPEQELSRSVRHGEPPAVGPAILDIGADELVAVICPDHLADEIDGAIPVSACRGLEFDTVLVVAPDQFARRDLYVAQTRATRRLVIVLSPGALLALGGRPPHRGAPASTPRIRRRRRVPPP
nr:AAA family ATPase [Actinoplanes globisporus]